MQPYLTNTRPHHRIRGSLPCLLGCCIAVVACAATPPTLDAGAQLCSATDAAGGSETAVQPGIEIMHASFEEHSAGPFTMDMVEGDFGGIALWNNGLDEGRATIVEEAGARFLRVTYPAGQFGPNAGGVQFMVPLAGSHDELYLSYRLRFGSDFQFVKGGKLPGLVGGTAPTGCGLDPATVSGGFSARMMWRTGGTAVQLMYTSNLVNDCGDDLPYAVCGAAAHFVPGRWLRVVNHLRMNTPGQSDGTLEAWLDGGLALARKDVRYRGAERTFHIDTLYFSTFFGGSDAGWAPTTDQVVDFDDFIISTAALP
jgi:hypothetical protein